MAPDTLRLEGYKTIVRLAQSEAEGQKKDSSKKVLANAERRLSENHVCKALLFMALFIGMHVTKPQRYTRVEVTSSGPWLPVPVDFGEGEVSSFMPCSPLFPTHTTLDEEWWDSSLLNSSISSQNQKDPRPSNPWTHPQPPMPCMAKHFQHAADLDVLFSARGWPSQVNGKHDKGCVYLQLRRASKKLASAT